MMLEFLTPEGVSLLKALTVIGASFATSMITAAFGLGGGVALLALMTLIFPPSAVIPVHGIAQLGANASRFAMLARSVDWTIIGWFLIGSAIGAILGARVYLEIAPWLLRTLIGLFILFTVWGPKPSSFQPGIKTYLLTGVAGSFLTMFVGATGPIVAAMLGATKLDRMGLVATHAAAMVAQHGMKSLAFVGLGFAFGEWAGLLAGILVAGVAGTYAGARMLKAMPEGVFRQGFKYVLSFMGAYLATAGVIEAFKSLPS